MADDFTINDGLSFKVESDGTQKFIQNLNSISKQLNNLNVQVVFLNQVMGDQTIKVNETSKAFDKSTKKAKNWGKTISKSILSFISFRTLGRAIGGVINQAGAWIENLNLFSVTFNDQAEEMLDWAVEFSNRLGVSNNEIIKMSGLFKQVAESIGITSTYTDELTGKTVEVADSLSKTLTSLTYDLASFYNIANVKDVSEKLQSGIFAGQIRSVRSFGFDVSQESVQTLLDTNETLKELGLSARNLTQAQKAIARTIIILRDGQNAFGDMARTIDSLQNRFRVLQGSFENLKLALGSALQTPVSNLLAYATGAIQAITTVIHSLSGGLQGVENEVADTTENLGDTLEETEDKANNLSFDKFESLTSSENENLTTTKALNDLLAEQSKKYEEIASQFDGIDETVNNVKNAILDWVFPNRTKDDLGEMNDTLLVIRDCAIILFNLIKDNAPPIIDAITTVLKIIKPIAEGFLPVITSLIESLLPTIVTLIDIISKVFSISMVFLTPIVSALSFVVGVLNVILEILNAILSLNFSNLGDKISKAFTKPLGLTKSWLMGSLDVVAGAYGFASGGIPDKSELFYMNENGVPEALINTGGSQTNVVNMQQLRQMTKEGFIEAIRETGLGNGFKMVLEGRNIDNSSIARGIFPALKVESKRQGGNQL